jgi:hypothetical protein
MLSLVLALLIASGLAACSPTPEPTPPSPWAVVFRDLSSGLVSVAGRSSRDVWAVGGDAGDGKGPWVLRYDGTTWRRLATGATGDLWWVHLFDDGTAYLGGAGGLLLEYRDGAFTRVETPSKQVIFGIWGARPDDAWAVGGDPDAGTSFAWRRDGSGWKPFVLPPGIKVGGALYKVWGTGADDVSIVGANGTWLHWDGAEVTQVNTDPRYTTSEKPLFTVHGAGGRAVAVGGYAGGLVLERDATGVSAAPVTGLLGLSGVFMSGAEAGVAVGQKLAVLERTASGWKRVSTGVAGSEDLHAAWIDEAGGVWAVGGDILSLPLAAGVLLHKGAAVATTITD